MARIKSPLGCGIRRRCSSRPYAYVCGVAATRQDDSAAEPPPADGLEDLSSVSEYTY